MLMASKYEIIVAQFLALSRPVRFGEPLRKGFVMHECDSDISLFQMRRNRCDTQLLVSEP